MDLIFDTATRTLAIDTTDIRPWGADLRAMIERYGQTVRLKGVKMRLTIMADNEQVFDLQLPPPGVRYVKTNQDVLATARCRWSPDQTIGVTAWCRTSTGEEITETASFVAPRPPQPYPSWTWSGSAWQAPDPYPDDGGEYAWDEDLQAWVEQEEE